jgi:hypothetical protein
MCVWDGTYTAPEAEREAIDQIPGWHDEAAPIPEARHASDPGGLGFTPFDGSPLGGAQGFKPSLTLRATLDTATGHRVPPAGDAPGPNSGAGAGLFPNRVHPVVDVASLTPKRINGTATPAPLPCPGPSQGQRAA